MNAIARGDQATAAAICASNSNIQCERSGSVAVEATVNSPTMETSETGTSLSQNTLEIILNNINQTWAVGGRKPLDMVNAVIMKKLAV